jgi:hypothetical protein
MSRKNPEEKEPRLTLSKFTGCNLIATSPNFYDSAVNAALMMIVEDPSASAGEHDNLSKIKATENLLNKYPT